MRSISQLRQLLNISLLILSCSSCKSSRTAYSDASNILKHAGLRYDQFVMQVGEPISQEYTYHTIDDELEDDLVARKCEYPGGIVVSFNFKSEMLEIFVDNNSYWRNEPTP
jgi:hypothetical protein